MTCDENRVNIFLHKADPICEVIFMRTLTHVCDFHSCFDKGLKISIECS